MTGSLQEKNGKYYAVINTYINGKRKQKWVDSGLSTSGPNKTKAQRFLRETLAEFEKKEHLVHTDILLSDYLYIWLESKEDKIDAVTYHSYEKMINTHIAPWFKEKKKKLKDITLSDIQEYFNVKFKSGRIDVPGGLSVCTLKKHRNVIRQALQSTVRDGFLLKNPCDFLEMPQSTHREVNYYTKEELDTLLKAAEGKKIHDMIYLAALYGLRRSELCGLQWDSIDFKKKTVVIKHTMVKAGGLHMKDKTKNASSHRTYPLLEAVEEIFLRQKKEQEENRKIFGNAYIESPYVFTWEDGRPVVPDYVSHAFDKLLKRRGLRHIRFHDLRHSCASILLSNGCNLKDVQDWLGHADVGMTANLYGHLDMSRKQELGRSMEQMLHSRGVRKSVR